MNQVWIRAAHATVVPPSLVPPLLLPLLLLVSAGCGHTVVPSTGPHQAVSAQNVKIYGDHPKKYELLGRVELPMTGQPAWNELGDANSTFDELKAKAAALGANGLLLKVDPASYDQEALAGYHKVFFRIAIRNDPRAAIADAIFVIKE